MKLDRLTSTTLATAPPALRPSHGNDGSKIRRVGESERADPDRGQSSSPAPANRPSTPAGMALRAQEIISRLLRLGPQAGRLLKPRPSSRRPPLDEQA